MDSKRVLALVEEAKQAVAGDSPTEGDTLIVKLWDRTMDQLKEIDKLTADLDESRKATSHYYRQVDQLSSQLLKHATGTTKVDAETLVRGLSHAD